QKALHQLMSLPRGGVEINRPAAAAAMHCRQPRLYSPSPASRPRSAAGSAPPASIDQGFVDLGTCGLCTVARQGLRRPRRNRSAVVGGGPHYGEHDSSERNASLLTLDDRSC